VATHHIAQLNVARARAPFDAPVMADFVASLAQINALAEHSPGFIWRLQGESGNAIELRSGDDPLVIINLTVWETIEHLYAYTYHSDHRSVFRRRSEWFERWGGPSIVLWWLPAGEVPDVEDALHRLALLAEHGPTRDAFTFRQRFPMPV
jgi:hypothetical protein